MARDSAAPPQNQLILDFFVSWLFLLFSAARSSPCYAIFKLNRAVCVMGKIIRNIQKSQVRRGENVIRFVVCSFSLLFHDDLSCHVDVLTMKEFEMRAKCVCSYSESFVWFSDDNRSKMSHCDKSELEAVHEFEQSWRDDDTWLPHTRKPF